jgi:hypothetical protein
LKITFPDTLSSIIHKTILYLSIFENNLFPTTYRVLFIKQSWGRRGRDRMVTEILLKVALSTIKPIQAKTVLEL